MRSVLSISILDFPAFHGVCFQNRCIRWIPAWIPPQWIPNLKGLFAAQLTAQPIMRNSKKYRFRCVPHCVPIECVPCLGCYSICYRQSVTRPHRAFRCSPVLCSPSKVGVFVVTRLVTCEVVTKGRISNATLSRFKRTSATCLDPESDQDNRK